MAEREENLQGSFNRLSERQIEIYAVELQEHYHAERRLRRELESRNQELGKKVNELLSLNRLFQRFISEGMDNSNTGETSWLEGTKPNADRQAAPQATPNKPDPENLSDPDLLAPLADLPTPAADLPVPSAGLLRQIEDDLIDSSDPEHETTA